MEYYFSGTIERVIFENQSSFFRILLLDINDTDAEDYDDFDIIVTGPSSEIWPTVANESLWTSQTH